MRGRAVFTIVQNEPRFLPLWLSYYTRHFAPEDVYVLDHGSTDGSVRAAWQAFRPTVVRVHRDKAFDHAWLRDTVGRFQVFLLQSYRNVLFAEADEFVVADPLKYPGGLGDYAELNAAPLVKCAGFEVAQAAADPPLDWGRPVMAQRPTAWTSRLYSKPLLARVPVAWALGFHEALGPRAVPDADLWLFHLHRADRAYCLERHRAAAARPWAGADLAAGMGAQNRIVDPAEFDRWFGEHPTYEACVELPDHMREAF